MKAPEFNQDMVWYDVNKALEDYKLSPFYIEGEKYER